MLARNRSARTPLLRIVRAPPENVTSTVVSVASAAASHIWRKRSRIAAYSDSCRAPDHEPGRGPVRDDVRRRPALADDAVDPRGRMELLAPQADRGEQQDQRVERVLAAPRIGRGVRLEAREHDVDVLRRERVALDVVAIARVVQQRRVEALEQAVVDHDLLAAPPFLGRRPQEDDLARELIGERRQGDRRPDPRGGHRVVAAAVAEARAARRTRRGSRSAAHRRLRPRSVARTAVARLPAGCSTSNP